MLHSVSTVEGRTRKSRVNTLQWYLSLCLVSVHVWFRSSLSARFFGVSPQRVSLVHKTIRVLLHADSLSALEVCHLLLQGSVANISLEAGFSPLIQVFLSRFHAREKLGIRVAVWLAMAPLG